MKLTWLLLIYSIPAEPSRKRAFIWRELKKAGAVYLHDGVAVLPDRPEAHTAFAALAARVEEFGGQATVATGARLDPLRALAVVDEINAARRVEYGAIAQEIEQLLAHVRREVEHRDLTLSDLLELRADAGKLRRWHELVIQRDYFGVGEAAAVLAVIDRCDAILLQMLARITSPGEGTA